MKILIIISISIILTLIMASTIKQKKIVSCLSDCYYQCGSLFTVGMLLVAAMMTPVALAVNDSVVSFLMTGSLAFVGVAADYQGTSEMERKVHVTAAYIACIAAIVFTINSLPSGQGIGVALQIFCPPMAFCAIALICYDSRLLFVELAALSTALSTCWLSL